MNTLYHIKVDNCLSLFYNIFNKFKKRFVLNNMRLKMQIDILFGILITIINKGKVSANELSLKFEISRRTVFRYINILGTAQIPIIGHSGRNGGFSLADNFSLERMYFSGEELKRVVDSVNGMSKLYNDKTSKKILEKLQSISKSNTPAMLTSDTVFIDSGPWGDISSYKGKFSALNTAINKSQECIMVYHDIKSQISTRKIWPHTLVFKQGIWYAYAYCTMRTEFRLFKIGRIASIELCDTYFTKMNIDITTLPYNQNWLENTETVNIVLEIKPEIRSEIEEWLSFENVTSNKDGKIYAFAKLPENGLIQKLLSYGKNIKIIEPVYLKNRLLSTVEGIVDLYNQSNKTIIDKK